MGDCCAMWRQIIPGPDLNFFRNLEKESCKQNQTNFHYVLQARKRQLTIKHPLDLSLNILEATWYNDGLRIPWRLTETT